MLVKMKNVDKCDKFSGKTSTFFSNCVQRRPVHALGDA